MRSLARIQDDQRRLADGMHGGVAAQPRAPPVLQATPDSAAAVEQARRQLFHLGGGTRASGADVEFIDDEGQGLVGIDVKTFDCEPNKGYFAINSNKHRQLVGRCSFYACFCLPPLGQQALLVDLVPYADVSTWDERTLRPGGTPSRNCPIRVFLQQYAPPGVKREHIPMDRYQQGQVEELARNSSVLADLLDQMSEATAIELRAALGLG